MLDIEEYALTKTFTPLLNTPDFSSVFGGKDGSSLPFDAKGLVRAFESVLFPKTKVKVLSKEGFIAKIKTEEYPYPGNFFVDTRFLEKADEKTPERIDFLPSSQKILETMHSLLGFPYIWGGNCIKASEMITLYPPKKELSTESLSHWTLAGVDCSGLIYFATKGLVPRNTSSWTHFGKQVPIQGKKIEEIIPLLKPLDAILWKGHIVFIYDTHHTIESRIGKGVVLTPIKERFEELLSLDFTPQDVLTSERQFIIRRWHP